MPLPTLSEVLEAIPATFVPVYRCKYATDSVGFGAVGRDLSDVLRAHHFLYSVESDAAFPSLTRQEADQVVLHALQDRGLHRHASNIGDVLRDLGQRYYKTGRASVFNSSPGEEALLKSERTNLYRAVDWSALFLVSLLPVVAAAAALEAGM
eukprot:TRINITY_DN3747_c0_g1_i1.p1 TRINITY_DN3747_c0_g1~~TRINITY_DN3747_c0_g1_i1.p1  ORF type:complete len:161 (+),score=49.88 TRINITY_DN3747_c0_g1_i1:29-484(+)